MGGSTTTYLVDDQANPTGYAQVIEERKDGVLQTSYAYGPMRAFALYPGFKYNGGGVTPVRFYGYDGHGSVRFLTDETASVVHTYDYDAFGNVVNETDTPAAKDSQGHFITVPNNYMFAGEQYDPELGLYYNRARYLDVRMGRFITLDPRSNETYDPRSIHNYLYAWNEPVGHTDPTGLYTSAFGYAVEREVRSLYAQEFPNDLDRVSFGSEVNDVGIWPGLRPDIFDRRTKKWEEIKPLSLSGMYAATVQGSLYFFNYVNDGYLPGRWPTARVIQVNNRPVTIMGTREGIIFYTDKMTNAEDLAMLTAADLTIAGMKFLFRRLLLAGPSQVDALGNVVSIGSKVPGATAAQVEMETGVAEVNALQGVA